MTSLFLTYLESKIPLSGSFSGEAIGITADSRRVKPGMVFVSVKGTNPGSLPFIQEALKKGAIGIITDSPIEGPHVLTPCLREAMAYGTAFFYPRRPTFMAAVTGTNGKSSTVHFIRQMWAAQGLAAASLGTLGLCVDNTPLEEVPPILTTPGPEELFPLLHNLAENDVHFLALEASSHGLDQRRLEGLSFQCGAFTSFSQDHLDYHGTMESYLKAKERLFTDLIDPQGVAVWNNEMGFTPPWTKKTITYGRPDGTFKIVNIIPQETGQTLHFIYQEKPYTAFLPLIGEFQVYNALCALGIFIASGYPFEKGLEVFPSLQSVPGRMEHVITLPNGAFVVVDYSHTPDSLERALKSLRAHTSTKLHCLFGCGGDRDKDKRPLMGRVAQEYADIIWITDDNPRHESAAQIRLDILKECKKGHEIADRKEAIKKACEALGPHDILLVAGKGHEDYQIWGDEKRPFHDPTVILNIVKEIVDGVMDK